MLHRTAHEQVIRRGKSDGMPSYNATASSKWTLTFSMADLRWEEAAGKEWFDIKPGTRTTMRFCTLHGQMSTNGSIDTHLCYDPDPAQRLVVGRIGIDVRHSAANTS